MIFPFLLPQEGLSGRNGLMSLQFSDWISFCALIVSIFSLILSYERTSVKGPKFCVEKAFVDTKLSSLTGRYKINVKLRIINKGDRRGILDYQYKLMVYRRYRLIERTPFGSRVIDDGLILKRYNTGSSEELDVGNSEIIDISFLLDISDLEEKPFVRIEFNGDYSDWNNHYKFLKEVISFKLK